MTDSPPAHFRLVCNKIMLENPHIFLMKTGSKENCAHRKNLRHGISERLSEVPWRFLLTFSVGHAIMFTKKNLNLGGK